MRRRTAQTARCLLRRASIARQIVRCRDENRGLWKSQDWLNRHDPTASATRAATTPPRTYVIVLASPPRCCLFTQLLFSMPRSLWDGAAGLAKPLMPMGIPIGSVGTAHPTNPHFSCRAGRRWVLQGICAQGAVTTSEGLMELSSL